MTGALIGLGSNAGDRRQALHDAVSGLRALPGTVLRRLSSLYATESVGRPGHPPYLNAVALVETGLDPERLLDALQVLERRAGSREESRFAPRVLDLDILDVGSGPLRTARLELPHPRLMDRPFVLIPLAEIAPEWRHPVSGLTAGELLRGFGRVDGVRFAGRFAAEATTEPETMESTGR